MAQVGAVRRLDLRFGYIVEPHAPDVLGHQESAAYGEVAAQGQGGYVDAQFGVGAACAHQVVVTAGVIEVVPGAVVPGDSLEVPEEREGELQRGFGKPEMVRRCTKNSAASSWSCSPSSKTVCFSGYRVLIPAAPSLDLS
ncbi:hypothetical protein [Streptomyces sp. NPDC058486]|uniref:hypothetical protein n=1 Tax=unclassified Streptomyces TaxID=2593676 RepID=UPI003663B0B7